MNEKAQIFRNEAKLFCCDLRHEMVALGLIRRRRWRFPSVPWSRKGGAPPNGSGEKAIWTFQVVHLKHEKIGKSPMNHSYLTGRFSCWLLNISYTFFLKWGWNTLGSVVVIAVLFYSVRNVWSTSLCFFFKGCFLLHAPRVSKQFPQKNLHYQSHGIKDWYILHLPSQQKPKGAPPNATPRLIRP